MRNRILKSFSPIHALLFCTSVLQLARGRSRSRRTARPMV